MLADGLTKPLPGQKFDQFVKQLGLIDISPLIEEAQCNIKTENSFILNTIQTGGKIKCSFDLGCPSVHAICYTPSWESTDLFFWLYGAIDGFLPLVKARDQEAWAVLAHFCLMVKRAETQWWLKGWADCMMRKIHMQLDEEHKSWILRLSEEMGWIPTATQ
ncbi:Myosin-2 heavy chain [Fusarium oxysporum f. sp. albedinis]|nr:Myosin-2 heavy chain [Fusarium oxysporum f. sp. albedinis]